MPRASAANAALTFNAILSTATEMFNQDGFHGVSVGQIATAAGVTRGAVYHYFTDKLGLLNAVVHAGHQRVAASVVARADAQATDSLSALRAGCHAFVDGITEDAAARILLIEGPAVLGWAQWRALDASTSMTELREAITTVADSEDIEALTHLLSGAMNEGVLWLMERAGDPLARASVHRALDTLIDAL
ncbi:MAG: TetR/AcrR family transcriptional regulator [Rhodoglobus sp.]